MTSMIFCADVFHARYEPKPHSFTYPVYCLAIDLKEIDSDLNRYPVLSYNKFSLFSIYDRDYLEKKPGSILEKLATRGVDVLDTERRFVLLTTPRFFGYVFNPVSFCLCIEKDNSIGEAIAEVHNTFGEKHLYHMKAEQQDLSTPSKSIKYRFPKEFYVSPFLAISGEYEMELGEWGEHLEIKIRLIDNEREIFVAKFNGVGRKLTTAAILTAFFRYPLTILLTMSRIHFEAFRLVFLRSALVFRKPFPFSKDTVRSEQKLIHRFRDFLLSLLKNQSKCEAAVSKVLNEEKKR